MRKNFNTDEMFAAIRQDFATTAVHRINNRENPQIDTQMNGFSLFFLIRPYWCLTNDSMTGGRSSAAFSEFELSAAAVNCSAFLMESLPTCYATLSAPCLIWPRNQTG
jgi:hypothetical protein